MSVCEMDWETLGKIAFLAPVFTMLQGIAIMAVVGMWKSRPWRDDDAPF